jgi:hypothetical protein
VARQQIRFDPVVWERENVARQHIRFDPVVWERENGARRELLVTERLHRREEQNEIGRGAIADVDMPGEGFTDRIRNDKNGECFSLADKDVNNALALWHANMGHHRCGQHLKFQDPPPTLVEAMKQAMPDLDDALLTRSKNVKEIEEEFDRHHGGVCSLLCALCCLLFCQWLSAATCGLLSPVCRLLVAVWAPTNTSSVSHVPPAHKKSIRHHTLDSPRSRIVPVTISSYSRAAEPRTPRNASRWPASSNHTCSPDTDNRCHAPACPLQEGQA